MPLERIAAPSSPPVTLARAREFLRAFDPTEDGLITDLVNAATAQVERATGLALMTSQWRHYRDHLPADGIWPLPLRPLAGIDAVEVRAASGWLPVSAEKWRADALAEPPRLLITDCAGWPDANVPVKGYRVAFTAGFGDSPADVPGELKLAVLMLTAQYYERREGLDAAGSAGIPAEVRRLLTPWKPLNL